MPCSKMNFPQGSNVESISKLIRSSSEKKMKLLSHAILLALSVSLGSAGLASLAQTKPDVQDSVASTSTSRTELETYEGRLDPGDVSFKLHIFDGGRASAEWERKVGASTRYAGTYSGTDGNYSIKLNPSVPDQAAEASALNLTLRSTGGMVKGSYAAGTGIARDAAELKLTGVSTPNSRLGGAKKSGQTQNRQNTSANRNANRNANQQRRAYNALRRANQIRNRNRRIVIPGYNPTYRP